MNDSRLPGLHRLDLTERIDELIRSGWLSELDAATLRSGGQVLSPRAANKLIENVIATFGLPFAIAPNFRVNGRDYIVPLVVEEPSIVAALSGAARLARAGGGFEVDSDDSLATGQVHLANVADSQAASSAILAAKDRLLALANEIQPRLVARGGGVRDIEVRELALPGGENSLVVHLLVDTCDAMGANLVNTICEAVAPELAALADGEIAMSILSNLADHSVVTARVRYPLAELASSTDQATTTRDAIVRAGQIAQADPYRAATHNKGIMNGIDALAIATGNDWRAIEAGGHAFAAKDGHYRSLTQWSVDDAGDLLGEIRLPLKVGIVGGSVDANPAAKIGLRITGVDSAAELAGLMASVGLAQNFAALRALVTSGIQEGHMRLHARSVAAAAGVPDQWFEDVVTELVASGEIKTWKAREILVGKEAGEAEAGSVAAGKVILLGEHAVVYGKHALALPIRNAVSAKVTTDNPQSTLTIPAWGVWHELDPEATKTSELDAAISLIASELDVRTEGVGIQVHSRLPRAMGLGSSAAIAVAIIRGFDLAFKLGIDDERVNAIAYECEKLAHGTPSGVDNTIATYARPMLFRRGAALDASPLELSEPPPIVIACGHSGGLTVEQVAGVRARREANLEHYDRIFDEIDDLSRQGADALMAANFAQLGSLMNICHGLLNAIEVSTPELESMVSIARVSGAAGAKLTGAGGGGSIVAVCPGAEDVVEAALAAAGFTTMNLHQTWDGELE